MLEFAESLIVMSRWRVRIHQCRLGTMPFDIVRSVNQPITVAFPGPPRIHKSNACYVLRTGNTLPASMVLLTEG